MQLIDIEPLGLIAEALADPTRRRLYEAIARKPDSSMGDLARDVQRLPQVLSFHVRPFLMAGLVEVRRDGTRRLLRVTPIAAILAQTAREIAAWEKRSP